MGSIAYGNRVKLSVTHANQIRRWETRYFRDEIDDLYTICLPPLREVKDFFCRILKK